MKSLSDTIQWFLCYPLETWVSIGLKQHICKFFFRYNYLTARWDPVDREILRDFILEQLDEEFK